jgi:hypothetical protein
MLEFGCPKSLAAEFVAGVLGILADLQHGSVRTVVPRSDSGRRILTNGCCDRRFLTIVLGIGLLRCVSVKPSP